MNHDVVGVERAEVTRSWTSTDAIVYALGVGAANERPFDDLRFTTELYEQRVLPTFASVLVPGRLSADLGDYDPRGVMHAQESIECFHPLPAEGSVRISSRVTGLHDKGSGMLATIEADIRDLETDSPYARVTSGMFFRGEGGAGGPRGPKDPPWELPERAADREARRATRPEQAFIYRLNGDRNPLHVDPEFARSAGFPAPILHGLCTFGVAGRALLDIVADGDPARLRSVSGRLVSPFRAGDDLVVSVWHTEPGRAVYQAAAPDGRVVIGRGTVTFESGAPS